MTIPFIHQLPIWGVGFALSAFLFVAAMAGNALGRRRAERGEKRPAGADVILSSMLALLGLVMAFTYGFTVNHYEARKRTVFDEANSIGTAFRWADLIAEPNRTNLRESLLAYARTRIVDAKAVTTAEEVDAILTHTLDAQSHLWPIALRIVQDEEGSPLSRSVVASINDVLEMHSIRIASAFDTLPEIVLAVLMLLAATSLGVAGYGLGLTGNEGRLRLTAFTLALSSVIVVVIDFDRTSHGFVRVSQASLEAVIDEMETALSE